uniref:THAP-type domain-containing protein n=1 Tax=Ixodes ricinus TaxID=34613 RepID=A0A6B0V569_IXORI
MLSITRLPWSPAVYVRCTKHHPPWIVGSYCSRPLVAKDRANRDLWEKNLPRSDKRLEETSAVCELHFEPRFILRDYVHIIGGKEMRIPRGHPALTPDAVPTLLPSVPQDLSDDLPAGREERKRKASSPEPIVAKRSGLTRETDPLSPVVNSEAPAVIPQGIDRDALSSLTMPTLYWAVHKFSNFDGVAYLETALEPKSNKISIKRAVFICFGNLPDVACQVYLQGHVCAGHCNHVCAAHCNHVFQCRAVNYCNFYLALITCAVVFLSK